MNRYKITATRSNGTKLSDYFIEATEGAARKVFKECYRNEEYATSRSSSSRSTSRPPKSRNGRPWRKSSRSSRAWARAPMWG